LKHSPAECSAEWNLQKACSTVLPSCCSTSPTTGLDPGARRDLWNYLNILRESEGVTIVVTTHLMEEAEHCDRLAILNEGTLVALGTPAELKSEIGGDVVVLESSSAESLASGIKARFGLNAVVLCDKVRLEIKNGHRFVTDVVEAFPKEIISVSVSKRASKTSSSPARTPLLDRQSTARLSREAGR